MDMNWFFYAESFSDDLGYIYGVYIHRKKSFSIFPSPAGMSYTKLSLDRNNL